MTLSARAITPSDIAGPMIKLCVPEGAYRHETQCGSEINGPTMATTFNATQTFNSKGQPNDKDNDKN
jgi:hypothetical protein